MTRHFSLLLALSVLLFTCKKPDPVVPPTVTLPFKWSADIGGTSVTLEDGVNGIGSGTQSDGHSDGFGWQELQGAVCADSNYDVYAWVALVKFFSQDVRPTADDYYDMWQTGNYAYGKLDAQNNGITVDGAHVEYRDANGTLWRSDFGTGDQTGSTFDVTHIEDHSTFVSQKIAVVHFSCTMYDQNGNSVPLTNGIARGYVAGT